MRFKTDISELPIGLVSNGQTVQVDSFRSYVDP
jgi:inhibitor of KinA sporulation pathway (predicted exonuclease)